MTALATRLAEQDLASLSDAAAAAALNAPNAANGTKKRDVPVTDARGLLLATGEWGAIVLLARSTPNPPTLPVEAVVAAIVAEAALNPSETGVIEATNSAKLAAVELMLEGLVLAGVVTDATRDALLALADVPRSWAEANGYPNGVTFDDVFAARGRPRLVVQE
jgi:hypothetical protein